MCSRKAVASPSAVHATTDTLAVAHLNGLLDAYRAVLTEVAYDRTRTHLQSGPYGANYQTDARRNLRSTPQFRLYTDCHRLSYPTQGTDLKFLQHGIIDHNCSS